MDALKVSLGEQNYIFESVIPGRIVAFTSHGGMKGDIVAQFEFDKNIFKYEVKYVSPNFEETANKLADLANERLNNFISGIAYDLHPNHV